MSRSVIFDVGRVLIEWDVKALYRNLLPDEAAIDAFLHEVPLLEWNVKFDQGLPFSEGIAELCSRFPHRRELIEAFDDRWIETVPAAISGSVTILESLRASGTPLYAITNFSSEKWRLAREKFSFLKNSFLDVAVSGDEKILKPEMEIFDRLLSRNGLRASQCVFIDDSLKNVEGARLAGLDAIHFSTPEALAEKLREYGHHV